MAKPSTFPAESALYDDTKIPIQFRGGGRAAADKQVALSLLLEWIQDNLPPTGVSSNSVSDPSLGLGVTAGRLIEKIIVIGGGSGTFSLGTSLGDDSLLSGEAYNTSGEVYILEKYFNSGGSLYFSGFSGTLTVKMFYRDVP